MKNCPVCQGKVFDDMDTCFNCLYHFEDGLKPQKSSQIPNIEERRGYEPEPVLDFSPKWNMPKDEESTFRDYLFKYSSFLNNYLKDLT